MLDGQRILWAINLYSRVNHLRLQQELIRQEFSESELDLLTWTNHETKPDSEYKHREQMFYRHPVNRGGHDGARDSYDWIAQQPGLLDKYDYVVWSHADSMFSDYHDVRLLMEKMFWEPQTAFLEIGNAYPGQCFYGPPATFCDFFITRADLYRDAFPFPPDDHFGGFAPDGSYNETMEGGLAKRIDKVLGTRTRDRVNAQFDHTQSEWKVNGKPFFCCWNVFDNMVAWLRKNSPQKLGAIDPKFLLRTSDDLRKNSGHDD
jgi:hypothetical protein